MSVNVKDRLMHLNLSSVEKKTIDNYFTTNCINSFFFKSQRATI